MTEQVSSCNLPRTCIPIPKIEEDCYDWYKRHEAKVQAVSQNQYDIILLGDSLTHFWQKEQDGSPGYGNQIWNRYLANVSCLNLGFGFDRTQNLLWRLNHGELTGQTPKLAILNIGTNQFSITKKYDGDTPEEAARGIYEVVQTLRHICPATRIIVMAIFPRGQNNPYYHARIAETNAITKRLVSGQDNVFFLDITSLLSDANGEANPVFYTADLCHLSEKGYEIWYNAMKDEIANSLAPDTRTKPMTRKRNQE